MILDQHTFWMFCSVHAESFFILVDLYWCKYRILKFRVESCFVDQIKQSEKILGNEIALSPDLMAHILEDGTYTRMLRAALNLSWKQDPTKQQLCGPIPPIASILRKPRMCFAGYCWRAKQQLIGNSLWIAQFFEISFSNIYVW